MTAARSKGPIVIGAAIAAAFVWAVSVDVPKLSGRIKGDEATYIAMAFSLVKDGDLKYRQEDYQRFRDLYGEGPNGIFVKRTHRLSIDAEPDWPPLRITKTPVPWTEGLDYGKPFAYSVLAAPFAGVFGLGGMLGLNLLMIGLCVLAAVAFCTARLGASVGTLLGLGFVGASVTPLYGAWLTSEVFNYTLVCVAYFLWLYKEVAPAGASARWRDPRLEWIAAFLLGVATFSKISNALLIGPLLISMLLRKRAVHLAIASALFVLGSAGLFGVNLLVSGESNFQGGERNTYHDRFPFDGVTSFDTSGNKMATDEANDENILAPDFLVPMLRLNLWYFFTGRDAGFIPYYFPGFVILCLWLFRWRGWTIWQITTCLAVAGSVLGLLIYAPESWNGGGGPVGNRYFLSIYPAILFLVPPGVSLIPAIVSVAGGLTFLAPILIHPFAASQNTWRNPQRWPLRLLPVELTLLSESLPVRLQVDRSRILVNKDPVVFLYYLDDKTYFQEPDGFWVAPGTTDIVIRTEYPLSSIDLRMRSDIANEVDVSIGGRSRHVSIEPGEIQTVQFRPDPGVHAKQSYQVLLTITTASGFYPRDQNPTATDTRHLGVFITPTYKVDTTAKR